MIHPALILLIAVVCETFVQFVKRAVYAIDPSGSISYYLILLWGDLVFAGLVVLMLSRLRFQRRHWLLVGIFLCMVVYSAFLSGPAATVLAVRNTYLWIFAALLFAVSVQSPLRRDAAQSLVGATQALSFLLIAYAIIQVQSDYAFEKNWFELSETSLTYDGVTNFGKAPKAFSLMSGPTDFACFGLFALALGFSTRTWSLKLLGAAIIVISGTRGILFALPVWAALAWLSALHIRRNFLLVVGVFFTFIVIFAEDLITFFYAIPTSRFSLSTLAPRIELWTALDPKVLITGGGLAANLSLDSLTDAPRVIDSGFIYLLTEIGAPLTLALIYVLLTAAQRDLVGAQRGALQLFIGVLLVGSIAQIPFQTRLSNFLICLLIYSNIYVEAFQIRHERWRNTPKPAGHLTGATHAN